MSEILNELVDLDSIHLNDVAKHNAATVSRKSCEFTDQAGFCISKSSVYLNELQHYLHEFQKKLTIHEKEVNERIELSKQKSNSEITPEVNVDSSKEKISVTQKEISKDLTVAKKEDPSVILGSVKQLVVRMDESCLELRRLLEQEKERTRMLREKIDWQAYKRMYELPRAVQQEHRRCAYDIQELKWHCAYQGRVEQRTKDRVSQAEIINKRILEEIEFVKESSPLMAQKQDHEKKSIEALQEKQTATDIELRKEIQILHDAEEKFEQFKLQAEQEEKFLAQRILSLSNELKTKLEKFLETQNQHKSMTEAIARLSQKVKKTENGVYTLENQLNDVQTKQKTFEDKTDMLNEAISQKITEHNILLEENFELERINEEKEKEIETMQDSLERSVHLKTQELQRLLKTNKATQKEIEALKKQTKTSDATRYAEENTLKRTTKDKEIVLADLEFTTSETNQIRLEYEKLMHTLEIEREQALEIESNLILQVEALKGQRKEESHARTILQAKIKAESADFMKRKTEAERRKEKLRKAEEELQSIVSNMNSQVEKLESKFKERVKTNEDLDDLLNQMSEKYSEVDNTQTSNMDRLEPRELALKEQLSELITKENSVEEASKSFDKKLHDMAASSVVMNKRLLSHQAIINELNGEISELQLQLDSTHALETSLRQSLLDVQDRSKSQKENHQHTMAVRHKKLVHMKELADRVLAENRDLALRYMHLQNDHIDQKNTFISAFEMSLLAKDSLADKQNLWDLHTRLHEALIYYYESRRMQTKAGLSRFDCLSQESNRKLGDVQIGLEVAASNISAFLKVNNKDNVSQQKFQKSSTLTV